MKTYIITVFEQNGEKLFEEPFQAENDKEAAETGKRRLEEENYQNKTHRCVSPDGRLVLFHR